MLPDTGIHRGDAPHYHLQSVGLVMPQRDAHPFHVAAKLAAVVSACQTPIEQCLTECLLALQATGKAPKTAKQEAANGAKPKASKKGKEGPSFGLGKGTVLLRSLVDSTASTWDTSSSSSSSDAMPDGSSSGGSSGEDVLQLAHQLQGSGEEDAGQGSVPETLGEAAGALDRRTVMNLQRALKVRPLREMSCTTKLHGSGGRRGTCFRECADD